MSKGSRRRPLQITHDAEALRWELWKSSTTPERKAEIKALLKELQK